MAVLQKIRNRAGIAVIIFVGVALFLFVIDHETIARWFNKSDRSLAKINGKKIEFTEYDAVANEFHNFFALQGQRIEQEDLRELVWNNILHKHLMSSYFKEIGLAFSDEEYYEVYNGESAPANYKQLIEPEILKLKYSSMLAKGFYQPSKFAELEYFEENNSSDIEYVMLAYKNIDDADIKISESDLQSYYDKHQNMFMNDKRYREVDYVVFYITPSTTDSLQAFEKIQTKYDRYISGGLVPSIKEENLSEIDLLQMGLPENFFNEETGTLSDVILNNEAYFFSELSEINFIPDSVRASHILIRPNENFSWEECHEKADSLLILINEGADFGLMAMNNSEDGSAEKGGDLDWFTFGMMVPEFNDACFYGKIDDIVKVETDFGVHLIKITDQTKAMKKLTLTSVYEEIKFSEPTVNYYFANASNFATENTTGSKFDEAVRKEKLVNYTAELGDLDDKIGQTEGARELVRWVYDDKTKEGDVSVVYNFTDRFIVAKVKAIYEKGVIPFDLVKEKIEPEVIKNKKAEKLLADLEKDVAKKMDINDIAEKYGIETAAANNISFAARYIPSLGFEPNIIAAASVLDMDVLSKPIKGNNGVFVIKVVNKTQAPSKTDFTDEQNQAMIEFMSKLYNQNTQVDFMLEALIKKAKIEDYRYRYF
ncbi:MAG: peptidylprolyl isomerase [Bacteroidales bacterium]|jgi:peptidyl-prolyl cis-trans isomerase D|nr:peptidylprolyl isomerase [Bacteroidales bacterium]MCK9498220.1 peptidylprolyl isomerase [Bacteroidales bacterium]MDY0313609.1 peptidylprolyl isomerase [Bacteroidales bacterium]